MPQSKLSADASETEPKSATLQALPPPLRPDELTPAAAARICDIIRLDGLADHLAGALAGVARCTFERWRAEDAGFALKLEQARAWFEIGLINRINRACRADGTPDWRAQAWVLKHASSEGFAKPARPTKQPATAAQKCANLAE